MPSPTAGLFGGLAQGIFGRMREHEDEQRALDLEDKKNALNSLSSLLEHATPETRPVIYKQMADVMNLKGKHRGVWDMLTGQGRQDYHDQLSQHLDSVFGNVVGPEQYKQLQQEGVAQDLGAAFRANSPYVRSDAPKPAEGKIALRDPLAEHLDALKQQYGLQSGQREFDIRLRDQLQSQRESANDFREAKLKMDVDRERAALAAFKPMMQRAQAISGSLTPTPEAIDQAAKEFSEKTGLDKDFLKSKIDLNIANTALAGAKTDFFSSGAAGGAGRPMTENQQRTFDAAQRAQAAGTFEKWNKAKANIAKLDSEQSALRTELNNTAKKDGLEFDEANGKFVQKMPNGSYRDVDPIELMDTKIKDKIARIAKLQADKAAALSEMQGHRATLEGQFPQLYTFGDQWSVTPNPETGGLAPAGAPRTGTPPPFPAGTAVPAAGAAQAPPEGIQYEHLSRQKLPVGTVLKGKDGNPSYKITGLKATEGGFYRYTMEPVK